MCKFAVVDPKIQPKEKYSISCLARLIWNKGSLPANGDVENVVWLSERRQVGGDGGGGEVSRENPLRKSTLYVHTFHRHQIST